MSAKQDFSAERSRQKMAGGGSTNPKSKLNPLIIGLAVCLLGLGAGAVVMLTASGGGGTPQAAAVTAKVASGALAYDVKAFADGKARFYKQTLQNGVTVRFFILKSSDGVIRAAFDACDVCWRSNKGYYQDGDFMVCRNCGRRFASVKVNEIRGGCNPAPLTRSVQNDKVMINLADIAGGQRYFDFRKGNGS